MKGSSIDPLFLVELYKASGEVERVTSGAPEATCRSREKVLYADIRDDRGNYLWSWYPDKP